MLDSMQYLGMPTTIIVIVLAILLIMQVIGGVIEFKGKALPEIFHLKKYFAHRKLERETLIKLPETMDELKKSVENINSHYNEDNISKRNNWMQSVNEKLDIDHTLIKELKKDFILKDINDKRNVIIDFASRVSNSNTIVTREYFNRIFKTYQEYEDMIKKEGLTNGEVDVAYHIIVEAYEERLSNHSFLEDERGW